MRNLLYIFFPILLDASRFPNGFGHVPVQSTSGIVSLIIFIGFLFYTIKFLVKARQNKKALIEENKLKKKQLHNVSILSKHIEMVAKSKKEVHIDEIVDAVDITRSDIEAILKKTYFDEIITINGCETIKRRRRRLPVTPKKFGAIQTITTQQNKELDKDNINVIDELKTNILDVDLTELNENNDALMYDREGNQLQII